MSRQDGDKKMTRYEQYLQLKSRNTRGWLRKCQELLLGKTDEDKGVTAC